jgi:hypothetical protein
LDREHRQPPERPLARQSEKRLRKWSAENDKARAAERAERRRLEETQEMETTRVTLQLEQKCWSKSAVTALTHLLRSFFI